MNKEEIIINGVDVRFCQYFNDKNKKCRTCSYVENIKYTSYKCEDDKNCYYKQIRRLKEENEKLKQYLLSIAMIIEELEQQYDDIKDFTEIKEIKEILKEV